MIIVTASRKGGVGKSTLAVHLAYWLHRQKKSVILADLDMQNSSSTWASIACPGVEGLVMTSRDQVIEQLPQLEKKVDVIVADGPGSLSDISLALFLVSDLALLPLCPSQIDMDATIQTIRVLNQARSVRKDGGPKALGILNRIQTGMLLSQELVEESKKIDIPIAKTHVHFRQVYMDMPGQKSVVWESGYRAKDAIVELTKLFKEVVPDGKKKRR